MNRRPIVRPVLLGLAIFLLGFIPFFFLSPRAEEARAELRYKAQGVQNRLKGICRQIKWRCLYGKPYKRSTSAINICLENLTRIDHAAQEWALENKKSKSDVPAVDDLKPYLRNEWPRCPKGGEYIIGSVGGNPICSVCGETPSLTDKPPISVRNVVLLGISGALIVALLWMRLARSRRKRRAMSTAGAAS